MKIKRFFTIRIIILVIVLLLMLISINPNPFAQGIEVKTVSNEAAMQGVKIGDIVQKVNGEPVETIQEFNNILNEVKVNDTFVINTNRGEVAYISNEKPDITVQNVRKSNIEKGLDLSGGTRVLLRPAVEGSVSDSDIRNLIDVLNNRLNTYGLSDLQIR